jgi:hypothetical protein
MNVFLRPDGRLELIDFGAVGRLDAYERINAPAHCGFRLGAPRRPCGEPARGGRGRLRGRIIHGDVVLDPDKLADLDLVLDT